MNKLKAAVITGALVAVAGGAILAMPGAALAYGTATPWAPGGVDQDQNAVGGLAFFDSSGNQIYSGSTSTPPFAAYSAGYAVPRAGDTKATLYFYVPQVGQTPDVWSTDSQIGLATTYPNTAAPAPVNGTALPVNSGSSSDQSLDTLSTNFPNTSTQSGYQNVYEIRLYTNGKGKSQGVNYDYADISINSSAHTWTEVWSPDAPVGSETTSSTLSTSADPGDSVVSGSTVTLTDTVADTATPSKTPTGTVQFKDGGTAIGSPVAVNGSGVATTTAMLTGVSNHAITAVYTPSALSSYVASTSNTKTIAVTTAPATNTSVALVANPTSGPAFAPVQLTATVMPSAAAGTVTFFDANQQIGSPQTVSGGSASITYSGFTQGDHPAITASFTPTNADYYNPSVSPAVDYNAGAPVGATPDPQPIQVTVAPGALAITTPYTTAHPLNLGNMVLNSNGTELSATANFGDGSYQTPAGGPNGTGSIQVVDTRVGGANWTASASSSDLTDGHGHSINSQNVGLTALHGVYLQGNALQQGSLAFTDNPAAEPAVAPTATGAQGLGGGTAHAFATTVNGGAGSVGMYGTLTLHAPTSTSPGAYSGVITFTVA